MSVVVIGAGGGIGAALADALDASGRPVRRIGRRTAPPLDLLDEPSIVSAAAAAGSDLTLVIDATGFLHDARYQPEKTFRQLDPAQLAHSFAVNAIGPALLMKHFLPRLARRSVANDRPAVFATLSARVGSIADNRLGGWYGYRASKAALNQLVRCAAIELARSNRGAVCVALHPGTVDTGLSGPFAKSGLDVQTPAQSAARLIAVIDALTPDQTGQFFDQHGAAIAF
jgi:NAD(P)-dependent dehydrogenase (short-subunit alcohol dehydrogenase family)